MAPSTAAASALHYGPRPEGPEIPDGGPLWRDNLEGLYQTDEDIVAAILPPPLRPTSDPLVRVSVSTGTLPEGVACGEARITVQAQYGDLVGEYPLLVVHDLERSMLDERERLGVPAKLGQITSRITEQRIDHGVSRHGLSVANVVGMVYDTDATGRSVRTEFGYRIVPSLEQPGMLASDPELIVITRSVEERRAAKVQGVVRLGGSRIDPVRQLKVRKTLGLRLAQQFVTVAPRRLGTVPAADFLPYVHHRYEPASLAKR